jgi:hypothetical protein
LPFPCLSYAYLGLLSHGNVDLLAVAEKKQRDDALLSSASAVVGATVGGSVGLQTRQQLDASVLAVGVVAEPKSLALVLFAGDEKEM